MDRLGILAGLCLGLGISGYSLGSWEGYLVTKDSIMFIDFV